MTHTITRIAAGVALTAAAVGATVTIGAGTSSADAGSSYELYCYQNLQRPNTTRVVFDGFRYNNGVDGWSYDGRAVLEQLNGRVYVPSTTIAPRIFQNVQIFAVSPNAVCYSLGNDTGFYYDYGTFA